jgi:hypothetical protein
MKYFKPELLARCRSRDDEVAEAAAKEWEEAIAACRARLKAIRPQLPRGARGLCSRFSLHDARLLGAAFGTRTALFGILLRLEGSPEHPGQVLELNYHPAPGPNGGVNVKAQGPSEGGPRGDVWVQYDEFDLDEEHGFFTHSLLLTDGREIEVRFTGLTVRILDDVVTPTHLPEGERKWSPAEPVG